MRGFVTKCFKERHDLAQPHLDMVERVLRRNRKRRAGFELGFDHWGTICPLSKKLMGLLETEEDLTDLYKPQLNCLGLVALNGLPNDKLDLS